MKEYASNTHCDSVAQGPSSPNAPLCSLLSFTLGLTSTASAHTLVSLASHLRCSERAVVLCGRELTVRWRTVVLPTCLCSCFFFWLMIPPFVFWGLLACWLLALPTSCPTSCAFVSFFPFLSRFVLFVFMAKGQTPLHVAAAAGNLPAVKLLLNCGADLFVKDFQARTPRQVAKPCGAVRRFVYGQTPRSYLQSLGKEIWTRRAKQETLSQGRCSTYY